MLFIKHLNCHAVLAMTVILLSSCGMFSENYIKPQIATPHHWSNDQFFSTKNTDHNFAVASLAWWKSVHDVALNKLIEEVLANNNDINQAAINIQTAQTLLHVVNAAWVPSVGVLAGNMTGNFPPLLTNETGNFAGLNVSYTLNVLKIIREEKVAKLNIQLQQAVLNGIRLKLISQTASTYYDLIAAHDQLNLCQTEIGDLTNRKQHLQNQFDNGLVSQLEITQNQEQLSNLEGKLPQIQTNITRLQNILQVLLNKNPGALPITKTLANVDLHDVMPKNISSRTLEQRPDIIIAEYHLKIAAAKVGISYSNLFPDFNLILPFGVENLGGLNGLNFATTTYWLAILQGTMPLLDKATYDTIKQAKSANKAQAYAYVETVRAAFADVDNGLAWQINSATTLVKINEERVAADKTYQLAINRYKLGLISYADTLSYKLQLDNATNHYNQAKLSQINSLINLYQVLGSGYTATNKKGSS